MLKQIAQNIRTSFRLNQNRLVLLYHYVGIPAQEFDPEYLHSVSVSAFQQHIRSLKKKYSFVFIDELFKNTDQKDRLASITFDDGYNTFLTGAFPILNDLRVPATLFLNSDLVLGKVFWRDKVRFLIRQDLVQEFLLHSRLRGFATKTFYRESKDPSKISSENMDHLIDAFLSDRKVGFQADGLYCTLKDLKESASSGTMMYGNHSGSHYMLSTLEKPRQFAQIEECRNFLERHLPLEKISNVFSMPFGDPESYNEATLECLSEIGYNKILITESGRYLRGAPALQKTGEMVFCRRYLPTNQLKILPSLIFFT